MSDQPPGVAGESAGGTPVSGNELVRRRHEKLRALRAAGVDPFGTRFPVSHWAGPLHARWDTAPEDELRGAGPVSIAGRVMSIRHHGKSCFAHVLDQTGTIQLYARADVLGEGYAGFTDLDVADFIGVTGDLMRTRTGELTVQVKAWTFLSKSVRPLPEKWHGLKDVETRYRQRYVDLLVNPGVRDVFRRGLASSRRSAPSWTRAGSWRSRRRSCSRSPAARWRARSRRTTTPSTSRCSSGSPSSST